MKRSQLCPEEKNQLKVLESSKKLATILVLVPVMESLDHVMISPTVKENLNTPPLVVEEKVIRFDES